MSSDSGPPAGAAERRLIMARLLEIRRKCKTMRSRGDEFVQVERRLQELIALLGAGQDSHGRPLDYADLARSLQPAERLFDGAGFLNVAREVSHAGQALLDLAGSVRVVPEEPQPAKRSRGPKITSANRQHEPRPDQDEDAEDEEEPSHAVSLAAGYGAAGLLIGWLLGRRVLALGLPMSTGLAAVMAAATGPVLAWLHLAVKPKLEAGGPARRLAIAFYALVITPWCAAGVAALALISAGRAVPPEGPLPAPNHATPAAAAVVSPTPGPQEEPPATPASGPASEAVLPARIGEARQALSAGDLDQALAHLDEAALVDPSTSLVLETAAEILAGLVAEADGDAARQEWAAAEERLARARDLARRFELDAGPIDEAAARHARAVRWVDLRPTQLTAIRAAAGRPATVTLADGGTLEGTVRGLRGAYLLLEMEPDLGQGSVEFTKEIPLPSVQRIRLFEEAGGRDGGRPEGGR